MTRYIVLSIVAVALGLMSLTSLVAYGSADSYWWIPLDSRDTSRALILTFLHLFTLVGGVVGFVYLMTETEPD